MTIRYDVIKNWEPQNKSETKGNRQERNHVMMNEKNHAEVPQNTSKEIIPLPKVALKEKVTAASGIAILNQIEI